MPPGTRHAVELEQKDGEWQLRPVGRREGQLQRWRAYAREEIPALFGLEFSRAVWNVGFVKRNGHIFLLTTLDKTGHGAEFQYKGSLRQPDRVRVAKSEAPAASARREVAERERVGVGPHAH